MSRLICQRLSSPVYHARGRSATRSLLVEALESRWALSANAAESPDDDAIPPQAGSATEVRAAAIARAERGPRRPIAPVPEEINLLRAAVHRRGRASQPALAAVAPANGPAAAPFPRGDFNGDTIVDRADVAILARNYGNLAFEFSEGDLNGDFLVNLQDLAGMALGPGPFSMTVPPSPTSDQTPNISWNASLTAQTYDISIETTAACSGGVSVVQTITGIEATGVTLNPLPSGPYFACVIARDAAGNGRAASNNGAAFRVSSLAGDAVGDITVHPIDHASFVMMYNGVTIYVDPVGSTAQYSHLPRPDLILVTHEHGDHRSPTTISALGNTNPNDAIPDVRIVAPQAVYNTFSQTLRNLTTILANDANTNVLGVNVLAVPAYNANHTHGVGNGYVVTLGEARVYISGDTGPASEIRALEDITLAFVCMNVAFTMGEADAASVVRDIDPDIVYPYHYRNSSTNFANLQTFRELVGSDLGIEIRSGDWY